MSAARRTPRRFEEVCRNANSRADFPAAVVYGCSLWLRLQPWFVFVPVVVGCSYGLWFAVVSAVYGCNYGCVCGYGLAVYEKSCIISSFVSEEIIKEFARTMSSARCRFLSCSFSICSSIVPLPARRITCTALV